MPGGVYLIQGDGQLVEMTEHPYDSEVLLQGMLAEYPNLSAGNQKQSRSEAVSFVAYKSPVGLGYGQPTSASTGFMTDQKSSFGNPGSIGTSVSRALSLNLRLPKPSRMSSSISGSCSTQSQNSRSRSLARVAAK